ncbi:hypothetical protein NE683_07705 [Bariatricus massiliensis]|uniref:Defence against restriction A C-terminal domain-containing protein n=1 Tax=Bariatricus massiliensis TaxID=1745713 RepID=A0ABS8DBG9_9FIRM|nr:hypothetical protein [Bariatricus massiliensis]MCB7303670.1 hypothetical protein [Bariatricus massiliensis]MCB7373086.1 hypothetical protein [Bariatricus massiliensis]MCB7385756.1 hypothetical protein [Bariatricus massiliensis]MCB7409918.1 hypothetical protein [Bariatricus massiliensis]MCQ5253113.1 hypothetical protein [Bariatricus massiliensis]
METVQGYEIKQAIVFDNDRGFALGENPAAPEPFVTWQFTEENGQRDYYWGKYFPDEQGARDSFAFRVENYRADMEVSEKPGTELHRPDLYHYYSTQRPVDIGTFPKPKDNQPVKIFNYDSRISIEGEDFRAWGGLTYLKPLTDKQMDDYELRPARDNPDRVRPRPSITAQLKEGAARPKPTRQAPELKDRKNHMDR